MTPSTITQTSTKVDMTSRFLGLVGCLPLDEQNLWFPNQMVHDPDTWTTPHLLQLKREYEILVDKYGCVVQKTVTLQGPPTPLSDTLLLSSLKYLYKVNERIQERPQSGYSVRVGVRVPGLERSWNPDTTPDHRCSAHYRDR